MDNIMLFILFSVMAFGYVYKSLKRTNPLTPNLAYSIFLFLCGFSFIPLNTTNESLDIYTLFLLILSIVFFLTGLYFGKRIRLTWNFPYFNLSFRLLLFRALVTFSFLIFILECSNLGYIPILVMFTSDVYSDMNDNAIPMLHYFVQLSNFLPFFSLIMYKEGVIKRKERNCVIVISIFIIINCLSRQLLLLSILSLLLYYLCYKSVSKIKLISLLMLPVIMFVVIGSIRLKTIKGDRDDLEYLKDYANTMYEVNLLEVYLGLYSTNNFTTFKTFALRADQDNYRGLGVYSFQPFYTITLLNSFKQFSINPNLNSFASLGTYAIDPYLDFGIIGIIVMNLFYGVITSLSYRKYLQRNERWILPYCLLFFCTIMAAFTNYFNTFFIWFVIIINFLLVNPIKSKCKVANISCGKNM